jgi:glycosyltransferase involved in cell wall biosynthesis
MRILYISPYAPERCGIGDYTASFVRTAGGLGQDVGVLSLSGLEDAPDEVVLELPRSPGGVTELRDRIAAWDPDVVHLEFAVASYGTRLPVLLGLLRELRPLRAQVFATLHEVTRDTDSLRAPGRALYRRVVSLVDRVLVHTEESRRALADSVGANGTRVELVPHPRAELPAPTASAEELRARFGLGRAPVLLAFGFIHVDKGLDDLVQALHLLPSRHDVRVVVAGDVRSRHGLWRVFELRDRLHLRKVRRLIARFGLDERVVFTGYVPAGEMRPWFELCDAAVLPYTRIEQSGVANLAAAAGAPILASRVGGLVQEGSDPRWSFPASDPEAMAAVIERFLEHDRREDARWQVAAPPLGDTVAKTLALYEGASTTDRAEERDVQYA